MNYKTFIQGLEETLKISDLPEEARAEIVSALSKNILIRTNLAIATLLTEEEAGKMNGLLETGLVEEAMDFLSEKHPEFEEQVIKISKEVVEEFLEEGE
jgi:hypothetical protein